ncbi:protease inhibitor I9 family protein [Niallia sp. HCP3S3_B10]
MKKISEKVDASFKDNYRYTVVMNGFSLETKRENIEKIEKISGVKRIFEAVKYELPAEANNDIQMKNSSVMIGADQAQALGYEGEKTIVAILDTGLDTNHEAFQKDPQNSKYSKMIFRHLYLPLV